MRIHTPPKRALKLATRCAAAAALLAPVEALAEPSKLSPEVGWNYNEMETPRSAALGGATRAIGPDLQGLYGNPANMAVTRVYHLGGFAQIWPEAKRQSYGGAAVDSITSRVAGGLAGNYTAQDPDGVARKATDARLGMAFAVSDKLFLGATGRYLKLRQEGTGPFGQSLASGGLAGDPVIDGFSFDAGVSVRPASILSIGLVGTNLTNPGHGLRPMGVGGGVGVGTQDFSVMGDVAADLTTFGKTTWRAMAGGEVLLADHVPLRAGYRYDEGQRSHALSGGIGYLDQQFGIDIAVRRTVAGEQATAVIFGLQYFLESSGLTRTPTEIDMPQ